MNSVKRDPLVALAPLTFILSVFQIFSWGIDLFTILGVIISFLVLLSNFHALFRYTESLYVDHYSILMKVWAIFTDILSLGAIVCLIVFAPIELNSIKSDFSEAKYKYAGNFGTGFVESKVFDNVSAVLYQFQKGPELKKLHGKEETKLTTENDSLQEQQENKEIQQEIAQPSPEDPSLSLDGNKENLLPETENSKTIILFIPDKRGDTYNYKPYLQLLASSSREFIVYSGDFYSKDCKWFHSYADSKIVRNPAMVMESLKNPMKFASSRELYTYNILREGEAAIKMISEKHGKDCKIFLISDSMSNDAASDLYKKYPSRITGHFKLDSVPEYKSAGYGFIAETNPMLNAYMGLPWERDFTTPKLLVEKTREAMKL